MKKLLKSSFIVAFTATSLIFTSCTNENEGLGADPDTEATNKIIVNPTNAGSQDRSVVIEANANSLVPVRVDYTGDKKMRRMYITKNDFSNNLGPQPYKYPTAVQKSDGSIDIDGDDKTSLLFDFDLDAPENLNEVVEYVIWTTNDRGDFRDISDSNSIDDTAFGKITIKAGANATGSSTDFRSFTQTILAAPLAEGTSETFVSIFNGEKYKIVQQKDADVVNGTFTDSQKVENAEFAALWDFGYFHGVSDGASFASAANYMDVFRKADGSPVVNITNFTGLVKENLNKFYLAKSSKTTADFDAISTNLELDFITQTTTQVVNNLSINDVIEFVDQYGNKGLIKVNRIKGTFNKGDEIEFDVKVQVNAIPLKQ